MKNIDYCMLWPNTQPSSIWHCMSIQEVTRENAGKSQRVVSDQHTLKSA